MAENPKLVEYARLAGLPVGRIAGACGVADLLALAQSLDAAVCASTGDCAEESSDREGQNVSGSSEGL